MGNVGGGEILVILLAALIFLGPDKLPEVARQVGKVMGEIRKVSAGFQREVHDAMRMVDDTVNDTTRPARAIDTTPVDTTPVDTTPIDTTPIDTTATDTTATDTTATDTTPIHTITTDEPATDTTITTDEPGPVTVAEPTGPPSAAPPLPVDLAHGGDR
jgi:sec-independent protein translocase protein TatB